MLTRLLRKPVTWVVLVLLVGAGGLGLYWFQPWKLAVDEPVDEALSSPIAETPATDPATADPPAPTSEPPEAAGPVLLAEGEFTRHEHSTSGSARLIRHPDGSHQLELVDLDTSNGPDLRLWLTDQPVIEGRDGWHVFDDGAWVDLGALKGNQGNQVYDLPAEVDPSDYTSVSIWCRRFSVSFGAAEVSTT